MFARSDIHMFKKQKDHFKDKTVMLTRYHVHLKFL